MTSKPDAITLLLHHVRMSSLMGCLLKRAREFGLRKATSIVVKKRKISGRWLNSPRILCGRTPKATTVSVPAAFMVMSLFSPALGLHFVSKPAVFFPTKPEEYAAKPVPSLTEWQELWKAWDAVSKQMIPEKELLSKPIKLRNECIFYLGHIPTFIDIHIARATGRKPSEPTYFWKIFERGVDPDVDDPTQCHAHSEVPEEWPPLKTILKFQQNVRHSIESLYSSGEADSNGPVSRALWLGFEHEAMHLETLLYMLIQSDKILPPPGTTVPDFAAFAARSKSLTVENEWFTIPASDVSIGLEDPERDYKSQRYFGWDNERPHRSTHVKSFRAKARPITNGEYAAYLSETGKTGMLYSQHTK